MTDKPTVPLPKKIEMVANVAIIIAALAIVLIVVRNYNRKLEIPATIATGAKLPLKDVDWQSNEKSLVLAVSTTCHYCNESAVFYRQLVNQCRQQHIHTIAVLPQPVAEAESYLRNKGVTVDEIRQVIFGNIPIAGTPTLLLVDGSGTVKAVWSGKLPDNEEKEVLSKLTSHF